MAANTFASAGADAASALAAAAEDPVTFESAKALTSKGDYDAAIDQWAALLEKAVAAHGETSDQAAPLYYRYGDALLRKCEESDQLFGGEDKEKDENELEQAPASSLAVGSSLAPVEDEEEDIGGDDDDKKEELAEDVHVAFEVLEVARTIYDRISDREGSADCWLRLGDLDKLNGRFDSAIEAYEACLKLRLAALGETDRAVADVHWCLAFALECRAADKDCENSRVLRDRALDHYVKCEAALTAFVAAAKAGEDVSAVQGVVDELTETIADARARRAQELARAAAGAPKPKETTTIGFRTAPAASDSAPVAMLQPKRKKPKLAPVAPPAPPLAENGSGSSSSGN